MTIHPVMKTIGAAVPLALMLAACGGGGGSDAGSAGQTPATTTTTTTAAASLPASATTDADAARTAVATIKAGYAALPALEANLARLYSGKYDLLDLVGLIQEGIALHRDTNKAPGTFVGNVMTNGKGGVTPPDPDVRLAPVHAGCVKVGQLGGTGSGAECILSMKAATGESHFYTTVGLTENGPNGYTWSSGAVQGSTGTDGALVNPDGGARPTEFTGLVSISNGATNIKGVLPPAIGYVGKLSVDITFSSVASGGSTVRTVTTSGYVNQYSGATTDTLTHGLSIAKDSAFTRKDPTTGGQDERLRGYRTASAFKGGVVLGAPNAASYAGNYTVSAYAAPDANGNYLPATWSFTDIPVGTSGDVTAAAAKTAAALTWTFTSAATGVTLTYNQTAATGTVTRNGAQVGTIANGTLTYTDGKSEAFAFGG